MNPERSENINGRLIEEYYWAGKMVVYVDHRLWNGDYDSACSWSKNHDTKYHFSPGITNE